MKQIFLALLTLISLPTSAQPKIVGTLANNGSKYGGSIFRLDLPGSSPGVVYAFDNRAPHAPVGGIIAGDADWLYGSLIFNGTNSNGAFYKIRKNGLDFTKLFDYSNSSASTPFYHTDNYIYVMGGNELKKIDPVTNTVVNLVNNVYGLNLHIDAGDWIYFLGTSSLNKIKTNGSMQTLLHNFSFPSDGYNPVGVTEVPGDSLFGIQSNGGATDGGTMFSIRKDGSNFVLRHQFTNATGIFPNSNLVYFNGKLFGYTTQGGNFGNGTLYSINTDGSGFNVIYHFPSANGPAFPAGNISISSNGRIFGAFSQYFQTGFNTYKLYKIDTSGENFEPICTLNYRESGNSEQGLLLLNDKDIYFTALEQGKYDGGVLTYCDSNGVGNSLYHFGYSVNGFRPNGGVIKASDGKLYGTTVIGGITGNGVVFSLNNDGTGYTKLHEFTAAESYEPSGKLLEASDGKLYGACKFGVANLGMIYRLDKSGSNFQVIFEFTGSTQGYSPVGSLVEDANGFLYGINFYSVLGGGGSVFKINKNGSGYITLKEFSITSGLRYPYNGVTLSKGYLYGACGYGGVENKGGLYRIKTDGSDYQQLHDFTAASGGELPVASPIIASNGKLY
ncbi:MAG: choice-of-anchor tandem repeat GloVer-containing protein, partial [Chitinophagaceae bacterium]